MEEALKHFLVMALFAGLVAVVFGVIGRDRPGGRARYGLKVFVEFVAVGLALAWALYFIPG